MNGKRIRRIGIGVVTAFAIAVPATVAMATVPDYKTVKPAANPASVNPKVRIHHGAPQARHARQLVGDPVLRRSRGRHRAPGQLHRALVPTRENWGIYNCRTVSGSSSYSHAGGRAYDHHLSVRNADDKAAGASLRRSCAPTPRATSTPWPSASGSRRSSGTARSGRPPAHVELCVPTAPVRRATTRSPTATTSTSARTFAGRSVAPRPTPAGAGASHATACAADRRGRVVAPSMARAGGPDRAARAAEPRRGASGRRRTRKDRRVCTVVGARHTLHVGS